MINNIIQMNSIQFQSDHQVSCIKIKNMKYNYLVAVLFVFLSIFQSNAKSFDQGSALPCDPSKCKLPDCHCSSTSIPGGLPASKIPQIVMISFDDAINDQNTAYYERLFSGKTNPNGCNISATFFVSHEYTDYVMLNKLYHQRHAISDHSISHREPTTWWKKANFTQWQQEILGQREIISNVGFVALEDIKGFRAPFLQIGGDNEFKVLHDEKFLFESSMPTGNFRDPPLWPYTLDYKTIQECVIPPCPTDSYPGLWEVPMVDYVDREGKLCNMVDGCTGPRNEDEAYELFETNFNVHYKSNRAPFPIFLHSAWFGKYSYALSALDKFLQKLVSMKDVWVVNIPQVIDWVRKPTTLDDISDFQPWKCDIPAPPQRCDASTQTVCGYDSNRRLVQAGQPATHYLYSCLKSCLKCYPWVGDPKGENCGGRPNVVI